MGDERATALSVALREAMDGVGISAADLARAVGVTDGTIRNVCSGAVETPHRSLRDKLDEFFAPKLPGTTWRICHGQVRSYPSNRINELVVLVEPLSGTALEHLCELLREISPRGVA